MNKTTQNHILKIWYYINYIIIMIVNWKKILLVHKVGHLLENYR
jgi:hypothetical protein